MSLGEYTLVNGEFDANSTNLDHASSDAQLDDFNDESDVQVQGKLRMDDMSEPHFSEHQTLTGIDLDLGRYPHCVLWSPVLILSDQGWLCGAIPNTQQVSGTKHAHIRWLLPFAGHMCIADCDGVIHDFAESCSVKEGSMVFGDPTRYLQLDPERALSPTQTFDQGVHIGSREFCRLKYNFLFQNGHSHVARCLNLMQYDGHCKWSALDVAWLMLWRGRHVSRQAALVTWAPFVVFSSLAMLLLLLCFF